MFVDFFSSGNTGSKKMNMRKTSILLFTDMDRSHKCKQRPDIKKIN